VGFSATVMVVDDEQDMRWAIRSVLAASGINVVEASGGSVALEIARNRKPDAILLDVHMPGLDGGEILRRLKVWDRYVPIIMLTAFGSIPGAVAAVRSGAFEYLTKPFRNEDLVDVVRRATAQRRALGPAPSNNIREALMAAMGSGAAIESLVEQVEAVAQTDYSVLILGETGTGKEIVARALHRHGRRADRPFVTVDCGAMAESLIDSELFGHEKGAYTGATDRHRGCFEAASEGGTIFLDEIGNLPAGGQRAMLRALEERTIYRVGGTTPIDLDLRVIAATNEDPLEGSATGRFRADLYFRISEYIVTIPPLRARREDIEFLSRRMCAEACSTLAKPLVEISSVALDLLRQYEWPGNVRELRNVIRRAVLLATDTVQVQHISGSLRGASAIQTAADGGRAAPLRQQVRELERIALLETLDHAGGNKAEAARMLGIDYKTYRTKLNAL
jgi:two-component system response regulator HydG